MRILLIDANHIFQTLYLSSGQGKSPDVNGFFTSCFGSVKRAIRSIQPTHILFAMDDETSSFRRSINSSYKKDQFFLPIAYQNKLGLFCDNLKRNGISSMSIPGMEGKDIISTICAKTNGVKSIKTFILSNSRRLFFLINEQTIVRDHFAKYKDEAEKTNSWLMDKFGVTPLQWNLSLILSGDNGVGIGGISGIGQKTAISIVKNCISEDDLANNLYSIEGKKGVLIRAEFGHALLIYNNIVKLKENLELGISLKDIRYPELFLESLKEVNSLKLVT